MTRQPGLFDVDERLSDIGDQLEAFAAVVHVEMFRPELETALPIRLKGAAADRTSCSSAAANQLRLFLHAGAYWLMRTLRAALPKRSPWRRAPAAGLVTPIVGHVGDGNFHMTFLLDPDELARASAVNARLVEHAIAMGGACTGEHGVGVGRIAHVEQEHGQGVDLMRRIKRALDPDNILNPGKIFRLDPDDPLP